MSEEGISGNMGESGDATVDTALTAGRMMRNAREAAGLHVAALAVSMKIPVKKLEALEADRLDSLHDAVFVRALAASVCRTLKIDPTPVLSKLPMNMVPRLNPVERGINTPFRTPGEAAGISVSALISRPQVMIVIALLVGVAAVVFFPDTKVSESPVDASAPSVKLEASADQTVATKPPVEAVEIPAVQSSMSGGVKAAPEYKAPAFSPTPAVAKVEPPAATVASEPVRNPPVPANVATGLVVFKARGTSWVKVVDAKGIVQLSKTLADGEVAGASGAIPLSVVIGRVDVTDVEVRGKVFSLTGIAKDNVARFEVN